MSAILGAIVKFRVADVACVVTNKYDIVLNLLENIVFQFDDKLYILTIMPRRIFS